MFMYGTPPGPALSPQPDPQAVRPVLTSDEPGRSQRLLSVLRKLIDYGKGLALTLQERSTRTDLFDIKMRFGLVNVAAIIACITRGLLLATALEARLVNHPVLPETKPARVRAPPAREPHAAPSAEQAAAEAEGRVFRFSTPREGAGPA